MKKKFTLCADDFGQNTAINQGILQLVDAQRLTAVSCMTNGPAWQSHAPALQTYAKQIDIGLHINLTEGNAISQSLLQLNWRLLRKQIRFTDIKQQIEQQLANFINTMQRPPDFLDGHQHVHHFPIVRRALLTVYQEQFAQHKPYIRISANPASQLFSWRGFPKKHIIALTGAYPLKRQLRKFNIPHNQSFSGIYNFKQAKHYRYYFLQFANRVNAHGLIMCHPGLASQDADDTLSHSRPHELAYLSSEQFIEDCAQRHWQLARFIGNDAHHA
jgi:predicted glycoside hydrolase/deacetylase ChbG (UPF0249 family)